MVSATNEKYKLFRIKNMRSFRLLLNFENNVLSKTDKYDTNYTSNGITSLRAFFT